MKLIDKSALVAEIDRLQETTMDKNRNFLSSYHEGVFDGLSMLENFLDTLEVKEVDLDAELEHYKAEQNIKYEEDINMFEFAKHFFELGLKAQKGEEV